MEQSQLLLNILIPDLTLFWDFNAEKWDTNNQEIVVMCRDDESDTMYENGENIGQAEKGDIPGFPCLVIKNNERLRVKSAYTRSGEATYEFTSDEFDGSKRTQTRHYDTDINLEPTEDATLGVSKDEFKAKIIEAWEEFKDIPAAYQRDYIYYGITKANKPGTLNRNIREELYRFRIQKDVFSTIADQKGKDPKLTNLSQEKRYLSNDEILKKIWTDGKFEFEFKSYIASDDNTKEAMEHMMKFTIEPKEAFSIEKVHLRHKNSTAFRHSKNFYSVNVNNLRSRWIYPKKHSGSDNSVFLLPWDLYSKSLVIHLFVYEHDDTEAIKRSQTIVNEFTNKADFSIDGSASLGKVNLATKLGYGFSHTSTTTSAIEISTTVGSDYLGTLSFLFNDPIIKSKNSDGTYQLYSVNNGSVEATLLPRDANQR